MTVGIEDFERLPPAQQALLLEEEQLRRARGRRLWRYFADDGPLRRELYRKHLLFFQLGKKHRQRCFMAANRTGKTIGGLYEVTVHSTGHYPPWWEGRRFWRPLKVWVVGETGKKVRGGLQEKLLGKWGDFGTGLLPRDDIVKWTAKGGVPEAVDTVYVAHRRGLIIDGQTQIVFKSYEEGLIAFESEEVDVILLDEECPLDIYTACLLRTMTTDGIMMLTFTPLQGVTPTVMQFLTEGSVLEGSLGGSKALVGATWDDAPHLTAAMKAEMLAEIPEHERDARTKGLPLQGSGRVFQIAEDEILVDPFTIPADWPFIAGMDFGIDHPFGAALLTWNRDDDVIYVIKDFQQRGGTSLTQWEALKNWGEWLPWAWPHDGLRRLDKGGASPVQLKETYAERGFDMLTEHAQFESGSFGVEAGIMEMYERMRTKRWLVFKSCAYWRAEVRTYHRKDGLIVKVGDDVISASRYAYMMRRYAKLRPANEGRNRYRIPLGWRKA